MAQAALTVIIGGAGLLGASFCAAVAKAGYGVVVADGNVEAANKVAAQIRAQGLTAEAAHVDITDRDTIDRLIVQLRERHGRIDAVVNSAYPRNQNYGRNLEDVTYEDFCDNVNLHLGGYFLVAQRFGLHFRAAGGGNVINLASVYGLIAPRFDLYRGTAMTMPVEYAAIKSAIIHLTRYFARYFQGSGVRFNCISPGGIYDNQPEEFTRRYASYCSGKGMLANDDVSGALLFLLSDASQYVNGQNIVVDDSFSL